MSVTEIEIQIVASKSVQTRFERSFYALRPMIGLPQLRGNKDVFTRNPSSGTSCLQGFPTYAFSSDQNQRCALVLCLVIHSRTYGSQFTSAMSVASLSCAACDSGIRRWMGYAAQHDRRLVNKSYQVDILKAIGLL
jgi:hypothetical protein